MRILAVDDDESIVQVVFVTLQVHGYNDVVCASSGEEALQAISSYPVPFDCFLLDVQMPGMNGIELCSEIRKLPQYATTPVVMLTAMNDPLYIDRAFTAGATDYVPKPFETAELVLRVRMAERAVMQNVAASIPVQPVQPVQQFQQPEAAKLPFSEPVPVNGVKRVVNAAVLNNYAKLMLEQSKLGVSALALRVPELELVHARSDSAEFAYVVTDVSEVISDIFSGAQIFISYIGSGQFLCVGPKSSLGFLQSMMDDFVAMLNDPDLVYCEDVATGFSAQLGDPVSPKLLESRSNLKFLDRALENLRLSKNTGPATGSFSGLRSSLVT